MIKIKQKKTKFQQKKSKTFRTLVKCLGTQAKNTEKRSKNYTNFFLACYSGILCILIIFNTQRTK